MFCKLNAFFTITADREIESTRSLLHQQQQPVQCHVVILSTTKTRSQCHGILSAQHTISLIPPNTYQYGNYSTSLQKTQLSLIERCRPAHPRRREVWMQTARNPVCHPCMKMARSLVRDGATYLVVQRTNHHRHQPRCQQGGQGTRQLH